MAWPPRAPPSFSRRIGRAARPRGACAGNRSGRPDPARAGAKASRAARQRSGFRPGALLRASHPFWLSDALLERCGDEFVQVAVEHALGVADFHVRSQVLDAGLVEHVRADLVAPADVGLRVLELLVLGLELAHL